ncbi:MAG: hypothetical protein ACW98U_16615 [Candidatus Thorarchaeota archaeon]|jgi:hypothetical protein
MKILRCVGIRPDQIDQWLAAVPELWKKHRGAALWGVGMELKSISEHQFEQEHLVITEWEFSLMKGSKTMIVFLFTLQDDSCDVFISWFSINEHKIVNTLQNAFENIG